MIHTPKFSDHTNLFGDSAHLQIITLFELYPYDSSHFLNCLSGGFLSMETQEFKTWKYEIFQEEWVIHQRVDHRKLVMKWYHLYILFININDIKYMVLPRISLAVNINLLINVQGFCWYKFVIYQDRRQWSPWKQSFQSDEQSFGNKISALFFYYYCF